MEKRFWRRMISLLLCLALIAAYLPGFPRQVRAAQRAENIVVGNKQADPATLDGWKTYFGPDKLDTEFAGAVWTDKSVFTQPTNQLPGITLTDDENFLVALSAIAANLSVVGHTSAPTDTMLVLDVSGSMVDGTYEVGTVRQGNSYRTAWAVDMSLIQAMIQATNDTIAKLMAQNSNNRVGVVLYSGNASLNENATPATASVVLPLDRYTGVDGEYLAVDADWRTEALYTYRYNRWQATGETATYVASGDQVNVAVKSGLTTQAGAAVAAASKAVNGGTYLQNGLYKAMEQFLAVEDTVVPEGKPQAGAERLPVLVLMSDGAPTIATTGYNAIGNSNVGNGGSTTDQITFLTQLTAAYVRGRIAAKYQENSTDEKTMLLLTLGLGTENSTAATNTLYPASSNNTLVGYWQRYLAGAAGSNVQIVSGNDGWRVYRDAAVEAMNYVDKYYYAADAQSLIDSFEEIVSEISIKAESYTTLVEHNGADLSGYVTFDDELGLMLQVQKVSGLLVGDTLFTGMELAKGMNDGNLGTVTQPNARGDELVATVKERIPGTSTTQAQQLIGNAYMDQQLYYSSDSSWSNYIGWYADADGNYVGFWDKDSGYENAPAGAVYANRSYLYLGQNGDSDMMHVVVMVRTELHSQHQSMIFRVPAALLPTVQYQVTLGENDPNTVESFLREGAEPMRLVFQVGLRPELNAVNLKNVLQRLRTTESYRWNADGTVSFYTNEWSIGNDRNGNGIPDPEEVETAIVTQSHFHPALDNNRFYYTDDTVILSGSGAPVTGSSRPSDTDGDPGNGTGYFYNRYIYAPSGRTAIRTPISAETLQNYAQYDGENGYWYIPAGTMYRELARFQTPKTANTTQSLPYSFFPAVFENISKQDVFAFLGNNGLITVAPAQGIALTKTVAEPSDDPNAPQSFTFTVELDRAVASPVISDTDGNLLPGIGTVSGNVITVTVNAGQTVVISGLPTGTVYRVSEQSSAYYDAFSDNSTGTVQAYTVHNVDFVNTAKQYGSLVVSKDVNYPAGFIPGDAHNSREFTIHVDFTGDITGMTAPQNATVNGNRYTLLLKDGQSATFTDIPKGVSYQVSEDALPTGYGLQELRYSDPDSAIQGKDTDEVHVVNSYSLTPAYPNVTVRGSKTLVTNESTWGGESFTVELLRIDSFADEEPESTGITATMTEANPAYQLDLSSIALTAAGTYYFRVVEQIPDNRNENIAYDRTFGLFSITVGDADADGSLEIQRVDAYQSTGLSGDNETGYVVEKSFTNMVTTDRIYLNIQKNVVDSATGANVGSHLGDITFGLFSAMQGQTLPDYYALTNTQGQTTLMIPVTKQILAQAPDQQLVYYLREIAPALENRVVGMDYDESWRYAIRITWDDIQNSALVEYAPVENDQVGAYTVYTEGSFTFTHTNTYESNVTARLSLSGTKTVNGTQALGGRVFSFGLYQASAAFVPGEKLQAVNNSGNAIVFDSVSFSQPGIYYMVAKEEPTTLGGITADETQYHITVAVEKYADAQGVTRLRLADGYPTVVAYGTSADVGAEGISFNNLYTVTGSEQVSFGGKKLLSGRALAAEEFAIGLYADDQCTQLLETVTNRADGTFRFSPITYTPEDLGSDYAEKTYTYYVKELPGDKAGVTYDPGVYTVSVHLSHTDGQLVATPSGNALSLQIENSYYAQPVTAVIRGSKALVGDWTSVVDQDFTFQLFRADESFLITDPSPVKTATVTGSQDFALYLSYSDGSEGIYRYVLKEDTSLQQSGVSYDAGEYHITVNVSDPGNGQLAAVTTIYRPGTGDANTALFTNVYTVEPTQLQLTGTKRFVNNATGAELPMEEGEFSFLVLEGAELQTAAVVSTGYNLPDGTIAFTPIRYDLSGVHTYSIIEQPGDAGGLIYDDTVFTVTVTVTDNGDGTLTASADYAGNPIAFENVYTQEAAQVTFNAEKRLTGDWTAVANSRKQFVFEMYATGADFAITGQPVDLTESAQGSFSFGTQTYTVPGTYYYAILEKAGDADVGITYDSVVYHITVEVADNGAGKLIPTVTAAQAGVTVTTDSANECLVTVAGLSFTNHYSPAPATYAPAVTKLYEGDQMQAFDFVLTFNGTDAQTKQNDAQGNVLFDELTFRQTGQYELKIREQENALLGLIRWDKNVYTVTLQVEDDGNGRLFVNNSLTAVTSEKGTEDLVFRNAHHSVITQKDVFLASEPSVSIDGKAVKKGDELLYQIRYKNFDSVNVDVRITDTIPQNVVYVENSADHGGVFDGDIITWNIPGIAPGETVTVSFRVKVTMEGGSAVNEATVLEGENIHTTNTVTNPITEEKLVKDVFYPAKPTVSMDGEEVEVGDILLYTITYTNAKEYPVEVELTDEIPRYTAYVKESADNGGSYSQGKLTWKIELEAFSTVTVSFRVKVLTEDITFTNQAHSFNGISTLGSNVVTNHTPEPPTTPKTGDHGTALWFGLMVVSAAGVMLLLLTERRKQYGQ